LVGEWVGVGPRRALLVLVRRERREPGLYGVRRITGCFIQIIITRHI
jgi:hypothetical protein